MGITRKKFVVVLAGLALTSAVSAGAQNKATVGPSKGTKTFTSAKTAIKGQISDASGETYGVVGVSNSPDGAGLGAANTGGGADLVLDGIADGQADTLLTQAGIDRPSGVDQTFTLQNSGAGLLEFVVNGILYGNGGGLTNVDAAFLGGSIPEEFALNVELATSGLSSVHWDNLTDLPTWLDDGDDDTLGGLSCTEGQIARWDGASWVCSHDVGVEYSRTRMVGPVGTPTDNGAVLLDTLGSIPTPASQADAWLLKIEPGIYDVGSTPFEMKSWVNVEGSGQEITLIVGSLCESSGPLPTTGLVVGAAHAQLHLLTVQNTCAGSNQQSVAIYNDDNWSSFGHMTVLASGAADDNFGVFNSGDDVELTHMTVVASGASESHHGLYNASGARLKASRSSFSASGGMNSTAVNVRGDFLIIDDVTATARNATGGNYGIDLSSGDSSVLTNVTATASGGTTAIGLFVTNSSFRMEGGIADGTLGVYVEAILGSAEMVVLHNVAVNGAEYGLETDVGFFPPGSSLDVMINNSSIRGVANSIDNSSANVFVGGTQLAGGAVAGSGVTCAGVWDESYTFSASTCP